MDKITTIITDLDGTLWEGILAEKQQVVLNRGYFDFLKTVHNKGIQIFIISKNDQGDVIETLKKFAIDPDFFTKVIANWEPKYLNLEKLLHQTNIRPETVIFIDDNSLERIEVKAKIPGVVCMDIAHWKTLFEHPYLSTKEKELEYEIRERKNRYRTAIRAGDLKQEFNEDKEFLKSLNRELSLGEISFENLDRFTKLLVVTHRINFNPNKFADYDRALDYLYRKVNENYKLFAVSTKEGGVSLGLTGAFVVRIDGDKAVVEDGTFSCGIIGRDFEPKAILELVRQLTVFGVQEIAFLVQPTSTNARVREIFDQLGFTADAQENALVIYSISTSGYKPNKTYDWIRVSSSSPEMDYNGIPSIINFFTNYVIPLIQSEYCIINLGAAKGEVLGHLKRDVREDFYRFIEHHHVSYAKVDIEYIPEEKNIVASAEDLSAIMRNESQDVVMAIELLEHTEHFWNIINEMIRVCKVGGYIFITVPNFHYPKHEYPIDLWRIGPKTLLSFFPEDHFTAIKQVFEGDQVFPRRTLLLVKKLSHFDACFQQPEGGQIDWKTGLTIFP